MTELEPLISSPEQNRLLLRHARKTLPEIAELTGIDVREVAERLHDLTVVGVNWRDDLIEEKLLLNDLASLLDDIRDKMNKYDVDDEAWASMARAQLNVVKVMLEQLDKRRKAVNGDLAMITEAQGKMIAGAFEVAMEMAVVRIQKEHPDWDHVVIRTTLQDVLPAAFEEVESHVQ